jgi:ribonuclease HI
MQRMNVTISTDASFYYSHFVGGYAFQIKSDDGLIPMWGPFKDSVSNPTEAEMKALVNALYRLTLKNYKIKTLTINTDCEFIVKYMWTPNKKRRRILQKLTKKISSLLEELDYENLNIKHVKAHTKITSARSYVNDWCDKHSRLGSQIAVDIKEGNPLNYLPADIMAKYLNN